jgi:polyribonucleotide nucleotidyltransferase
MSRPKCPDHRLETVELETVNGKVTYERKRCANCRLGRADRVFPPYSRAGEFEKLQVYRRNEKGALALAKEQVTRNIPIERDALN